MSVHFLGLDFEFEAEAFPKSRSGLEPDLQEVARALGSTPATTTAALIVATANATV